jgi:hypothetical protein
LYTGGEGKEVESRELEEKIKDNAETLRMQSSAERSAKSLRGDEAGKTRGESPPKE